MTDNCTDSCLINRPLMRKLTILGLVLLALLATGVQVSSQLFSKREALQGAAVEAWNQFLRNQTKVGQSESEVGRAMSGKFRDQGKCHFGGTGAYEVLYLVDDFHQIAFNFDGNSKLTSIPTIAEKVPWLRFPNGDVLALEK
jgi:hypothetical protein